MHKLTAAGPTGYNAAKDTQDGYQFIYPFGWQEVSVDGQDVVYKDIIEPLESASVSITKTEKGSVSEFGNPLEVRRQPNQVVLALSHAYLLQWCTCKLSIFASLFLQVAQQLTNEVLTPRSQQAKVLGVNKVC